jgi:hypothetical protein
VSYLSLGFAGPATAVPMVLVQPTPTPEGPGGRGEDFGKSSPVGLLLLILFFIAVALLVRSMTKHLKRVPASFDQPDGAKATESGTPSTPDEPPANGEPKPAKNGPSQP